MKLTFTHDIEKDIWCILTKGKGSNHSNIPTKTYQDLISLYGEDPTIQNTKLYIESKIIQNSIDIPAFIASCTKEWEGIADIFTTRVESIFKTKLPSDITVYLTLNNRYPYNIEENYFFTTFTLSHIRLVCMHELLHFYT